MLSELISACTVTDVQVGHLHALKPAENCEKLLARASWACKCVQAGLND
jgi:hypothetical protein